MTKIPKDIYFPLSMGRAQKDNKSSVTVKRNKTVAITDWLAKYGPSGEADGFITKDFVVISDGSNKSIKEEDNGKLFITFPNLAGPSVGSTINLPDVFVDIKIMVFGLTTIITHFL